MAVDPTHHGYRRARSDAQKQQRRSDILQAARAHLCDVGFEGFSMGPLAKASGVVRGTLYLYFPTREEVLLALYLEDMRAWLEELAGITEPGMPTEGFLRAVFTSATRRAVLMEIAPHVTGVLEGNVSPESFAESKHLAAELVDVAGRRTALALGRPVHEGAALATALFVLMIGITQALPTPEIDAARRPDPQPLLGGEEPLEAFVRMGRWMVEGSQGGATPATITGRTPASGRRGR